MKALYDIAVVVPVHNAAATLVELNQRLVTTLSQLQVSFELIFINDGSTDNSWDILNQIQRSSTNTTIINLNKNTGQHSALICGFNYTHSRFVISIDDDLQYPPEEIKTLYKAINANSELDAVIGIPIEKKASLVKNLGSKFCSQIIISKNAVKVKPGAFRIIKREVILNMIEYKYPHPVIGALLSQSTNKITNIPVQHCSRAFGRSGYSTLKSIDQFCNIITFYSQTATKTIKKIIVNCILLCLFFFILESFILTELSMDSITLKVVLSLMIATLTIIISINMLVIKKYFSRLLQYLLKKPQYTIASIVRNSP
jgi:glycosyltransferase involved in cell wall biosynthesis